MKELIRKGIVFIITLEARAVVKKYQPNIVLVTGSVGKTSTKDALYAALKQSVFVRKSEKSYNSDIGVPLTVLGVPNGWSNIVQWLKNILDGLLLLLIITPYPRWLVVEVGADRPGDISRSLAWLTPQVVVTTRFPEVPVHVEFYDSPGAVIAEELFPLSLLSAGTVAVVNSDDPTPEGFRVPEGVRTISYGFEKSADLRALRYRVLTKEGAPNGISFEIAHADERVHLSLYGIIGRTHVYALLAGVAGALGAGAHLARMHSLAEEYEAPPGRLKLIAGRAGSVLIDDTYNASPVAGEEALSTLSAAPAQRRIAVLGDMLELGTYSTQAHTRLGELSRTHADILVTVGVRSRASAEQALKSGMAPNAVHIFERGSDASSFLLSELRQGDVVLVKGSQSIRMERIVKALMEHPEDAPRLLPRQDAEWLAR